MEVIATGRGFVLKFEDLNNMTGLISNLKGQVEWIKEEDIDEPYLYCIYDSDTSEENVKDMLDRIKDRNQTK